MKQITRTQSTATRRWLNLGLVVFVLAGMFALPAVNKVYAQPAAPAATNAATKCSNLDVIFLVDQSQSMGGITGTGETTTLGNDPTLQRKFAVEGMIDMMVDLPLTSCPGSYHRIGVISYGDNSEVDLPLSVIAPADQNEADTLRVALKKNIRAANLGQTNTWDAFTAAKKMFDGAGPTPTGTEDRKRVIILVNDGFPCTKLNCLDYSTNTQTLKDQVNTQFPFAKDLLAQEQCMADLRKTYANDENGIPADKANACMSDHPVSADSYQKSTYVWTVLLKSEQAYPKGVLENLAGMSQAHGGDMIQLSHNRADIPSTIRTILSYLAGVRPVLLTCAKPFAVNPYLRQMIITAYGIDASAPISMTYQDVKGVTHTITAGKIDGATNAAVISQYYPFGTNEKYMINAPYPGLWQLANSQNCDGLDVYYDPVNIDPKSYTPNLPAAVPQYDIAPYSDPDKQFFLEYKLQDTTGMAVAQADADIFNIQIDLNVTGPDGKTVTYTMGWVPGEGLFRAKQPLQVPVPGIYTINIKGTNLTHSGEPMVDSTKLSEVFNTPYTLFENSAIEFKVFEVNPFLVSAVSPKDNETIRSVHKSIFSGLPLKVNPLPVRVRVTDRNGQILTNIADMFSDPSQAISVTLSGADGSTPAVALQPDPNVPGEFVGEIPDSKSVGAQTLIIQTSDTALSSTYRPDTRRVEVPFTRADYLWTMPLFYNILSILIMLAILSLIVYNILIRTNPVRGTLQFKDGPADIAEFGLGNGTNFRTIKGRELSNYPQLFLKSLRVVNAGRPPRRKKKTEDGLPDSFGDLTNNNVRVSMVTSEGRKFALELMPNVPTGYGDETMAQMIYVPIDESS